MEDNKKISLLGDGFDDGSNNSSSPKSESPTGNVKEQIAYLKSKATNYIFLFGQQGSGKSVVSSSLIYHLMNDTRGVLRVIRSESNADGERFATKIQTLIENGDFPDRTKAGTVTQVDLHYTPHDKSKKQIYVTLLEMSGETLRDVSIDERDKGKGKLPHNIDVFFLTGGLSMLFILVTSTDKARQDVSLINQFLDYIVQKDNKFYNSNIILLISKWDKNMGIEKIEQFVERNLKSVYTKIFRPNAQNAIIPYKIGDVTPIPDTDSEGKEFYRDYIQSFDHHSPELLWNWIYKSITGEFLINPPKEEELSWWGNIRKWLLG